MLSMSLITANPFSLGIKLASDLSDSASTGASLTRQLTQIEETLSLICISAELSTFSSPKDECDEDDGAAAAKTVCLCACQCGCVCAGVAVLSRYCCHRRRILLCSSELCVAASRSRLCLDRLSALSRGPAPLVLFVVFSLIVAHNALTL